MSAKYFESINILVLRNGFSRQLPRSRNGQGNGFHSYFDAFVVDDADSIVANFVITSVVLIEWQPVSVGFSGRIIFGSY